jgi:hypothetical protein
MQLGPATPVIGTTTPEIIAVVHEIVAPRDAASGQATGKRTHKPFVLHSYA